jgi:hypothetical protein
MNKAERRQESERLRAVLIQVREQLDDLIGHLENDVLPPRMVAASAQHLMNSAMTTSAFPAALEPRQEPFTKALA